MTKSTTTPITARKRCQIFFEEESLTKQYFKDECDINNIVAKFQTTGQIPLQNGLDPQYGIAPEIDLKSALDLVKNTHREFDELSYEKKALFNHNPQNYADFLQEYAEDPQSFSNDTSLNTDAMHQQTDKNAEKTALDSADEGSQSET